MKIKYVIQTDKEIEEHKPISSANLTRFLITKFEQENYFTDEYEINKIDTFNFWFENDEEINNWLNKKNIAFGINRNGLDWEFLGKYFGFKF